ncbi:MAG: efflux transporter outer membrane subunit, partial [Gammaproteobacteria bacterium]
MRRRPLYLLVLSTLLAACSSVGPDYAGPPATPAEEAPSFPSSAPAGAAVSVAAPPVAWWRELHDLKLDALMDAALAANYDLRVAVANLEAARAALDEVRTRRRPRVDATASVTEGRSAAALVGQLDPDDAQPTLSSGTFGLDLSWELDLFGRIRRSVEAASAELGSQAALRDGVLVAVLGRVARAYVDLRGAQARLDVAKRNVSVQKQTLDLVTLLNSEGAATELDVARARTQLLTSQATIPTLEAEATGALNRLSTLTARAPGAWSAALSPHAPLPAVPAFVAVGTPVDLLRRRPDVQAAERALAAAAARIGVATADLFPTVSFGARVGVGATPLSGLVAAGAPFFAVGPALSWNLFDREAIYARVRQQDSAAAASMARYEAAVTTALEEVDSTLSAWLNERDRQAQLVSARDASLNAHRLAQLRYREGVEHFLTVLDAERSLLSIEDQLALSEVNLARQLIAIYLALGGGWEYGAALAHRPYAT